MNTWMQVFSETRNTGLSAGEDGVILRVATESNFTKAKQLSQKHWSTKV